MIGNRKGIWSYIYGPSAQSHQFGFKLSEIERDNLIVGNPPVYPCENVERTGVLWPAFGSGPIQMPPYDFYVHMIISFFTILFTRST